MNTVPSHCGRCGAQIISSAAFCGGCGAPVAGPVYAPAPTKPAPAAGSGGGGLISLILGILGCVMCGFFTGIPGAIFAWMDLSSAKSTGRPAPGMAVIGLILSLIGTGLGFLGCLASAMLPLMGGY